MQLAVDKNLEEHTLTVIADFDYPIEKVWDLYADPRKLERWWGPPTYPATVVEHSLTPGGVVRYYMTSPEGEEFHGRWDLQEVDAPHRFVAEDRFADAEGNPAPDMPVTRMVYTFTATENGTHMECVSRYESAEALQQVLEMGMEEGLRGSMGQMEAVLAEG